MSNVAELVSKTEALGSTFKLDGGDLEDRDPKTLPSAVITELSQCSACATVPHALDLGTPSP